LKNDNLWEELTSFGNLYDAFRTAAKSRRNRASVASFEFDLEENLITLQQELVDGLYHPGKYANFYIHDPKRRLISAAPFRDRVVHHALINLIEPLFERLFIFDTYANRSGKGTHRAIDRCTTFMRKYNYVLPIDIVQYFPSINHSFLYGCLEKEIIDARILNLCKQIIERGRFIHVRNPSSLLKKECIELSGHGLPIGNLTSQFWANVYLNPLDQFIKRQLQCKGYIRYVDDMLLFSDSKQQLWDRLGEVRIFLSRLALSIHESSAQVRPTRIGIPFLGFQIFPDHRRLKRQKVVNARRKLSNMMASYEKGEIPACKVKVRTIAWLNHARYGDTWGLRTRILEKIVL
jgi:RNA-directed DNA polymerase